MQRLRYLKCCIDYKLPARPKGIFVNRSVLYVTDVIAAVQITADIRRVGPKEVVPT
jgi:hypothetical protein